MKIIHVVENLNRGGLENVVIDLLVQQCTDGNQCLVICLFEKGLLAAKLEQLGVEVHACEKKQGVDFSSARKLRTFIRCYNPDVVHTHNAVAHYYAVFSSIGLNIKTIINTRHGMGGFPFSLKREALYRVALLSTQSAVSVCKEAEIEFVKHNIIPKTISKVVVNGVNISEVQLKSCEAKKKFLDSENVIGDRLIIGSVGRLDPVKDYKTLIEAFVCVNNEVSNSILVIAGDGPLYNELQACANDLGVGGKLYLLGDRSDVKLLLGAFDVFAMSSISEGYSIALLEACAAALPIVATDVGGNHEIVQHEISGLLVAPKSATQLSEAILFLLHNQDTSISLGKVGRAWVEEFGSVQAMCNAYYHVYECKN